MIENISDIKNHILIVSIKLSEEIYVISCDNPEQQAEVFETIKCTGKLPEKYDSHPVAAVFKAVIEDRYLDRLLINHPLSTNIN